MQKKAVLLQRNLNLSGIYIDHSLFALKSVRKGAFMALFCFNNTSILKIFRQIFVYLIFF